MKACTGGTIVVLGGWGSGENAWDYRGETLRFGAPTRTSATMQEDARAIYVPQCASMYVNVSQCTSVTSNTAHLTCIAYAA